MTDTYIHALAGTGGGGGAGITDLSGDVVATGPGSVPATIQTHAVTYAKIQSETASTLLGNPTGSTANVQEITLGTGLSFAGSVLNADTGSGTYFVNTFTLDSTDISNEYVTLTQVPTNPTLTVLNVVAGTVQDYSVDYTISSNQLSWSGLGLASLLDVDDQLIVQCN